MATPKAIQLRDEAEARRLAAYLRGYVDEAEQERATFLAVVKDNRKLLLPRQPRANPPFEGACDLALLTAKYQINALRARLYRAILSPAPVFDIDCADEGVAQRLERFLEEVNDKQAHLRTAGARLLDGALTDGVGIAYVSWQTIQREQAGWAQDGMGAWRKARSDRTVYDGPQVEAIPIEKAWTYPPTSADFQKSSGVYVLTTQTGDDLLQASRNGDYDQEAVERMKTVSPDREARRTVSDDAREVSDGETTAIPFHANGYTITECYWRYAPDENKPAEDWLFTLHAPSYTLLRAIPNPWGHGRRPLVAVRVWPDRFGVAGDSALDLVGDIQRFTTVLIRMSVDAIALGISPPLMYDKAIGEDAARELAKRRGPGGMMPVEGHLLTEPKYKPLLDSPYRPDVAMPMLEMLRQYTERATGISDMSLGRVSSKQTTLGEVQEVLGEGDENEAMLVAEAAPSFVEIAETEMALFNEFADHTETQRLYAEANELPYNEQTTPLVFAAMVADLNTPYTILAAGSSEAGNRAMQVQKAQKMLELVATDPLSTPEQRFAAKASLVSALGTKAPERFIGTKDEYVQRALAMDQVQAALAQAQEQMEMQGKPGQPEGTLVGQ